MFKELNNWMQNKNIKRITRQEQIYNLATLESVVLKERVLSERQSLYL